VRKKSLRSRIGVTDEKLEKLIAKRDQVNAKIRQEQGRDRTRKRRQDTRRKIIAGALVLAEESTTIKSWLHRTLDKVLKRDDERALFGLAPLPPPSGSNKTEPGNSGERPAKPGAPPVPQGRT
jgi:hypothetical protein